MNIKGCLVRILLNTIALVIAACLVAIANKFLPEYFEICTVFVVVNTIVFLVQYNRPPATVPTKKQFDSVLANICTITSNIIIYIDEFLIEEGVLFDPREPVEYDESKHPVIFFENYVDNVLTRTPKSLLEDKKDYSKLGDKLKEKAKLLYLQINSSAMASCEDKALITNINKVYQNYTNLENLIFSGNISQRNV